MENKTGGDNGSVNDNSAWDEMEPVNDIAASLEGGASPTDVLDALVDEGSLTVDLLEAAADDLRSYGLTDDQYDHYDHLARSGKPEVTAEELRKFDDEEPEAAGFES